MRLSADRKAVESIFAEGPTVKGTIKAVDPTANTITVAVNEGKQLVDKTFDAKSAPVVIADAGGDKSKASEHKLADLPVGAIATLRLSPALHVVSISAEGPSFAGTVKQVDATARRFTLTFSVAKGEPVQEREFALAADARVAIDGGTGRTVSELPPGALVKIQLSADQKSVRSIDAEGPTVQGVVTALDSERFGITIADKVGEKSFLVARDAQITIDGKENEFALLPAGAVVRARLSVDQTTARSISAEGPSVKGKATAVDPTNYSITVYVNKEGDKTFDIAREAKVVTEIYSLPIKLAELKPEKEVNLLLTADRKSVMRITVFGE
ncbi:MAG: hypothetical protein HY000_29775 [Planctomycetes bacterium]|nr:hypothetical protein [Planctomycetota bacterium]